MQKRQRLDKALDALREAKQDVDEALGVIEKITGSDLEDLGLSSDDLYNYSASALLELVDEHSC
jgi:hypothetical protein